MTDHPITPPPELVASLRNSAPHGIVTRELWLINHAYAAGADQELNECCKWLPKWLPKLPPWSADDLHKHRRPKPPSLKEEALDQLKSLEVAFLITHGGNAKTETIRRALESLPS